MLLLFPSPDRFAYKDEYEKFKLVLTVILFVFSFTCRFLFSYRWDFTPIDTHSPGLKHVWVLWQCQWNHLKIIYSILCCCDWGICGAVGERIDHNCQRWQLQDTCPPLPLEQPILFFITADIKTIMLLQRGESQHPAHKNPTIDWLMFFYILDICLIRSCGDTWLLPAVNWHCSRIKELII